MPRPYTVQFHDSNLGLLVVKNDDGVSMGFLYEHAEGEISTELVAHIYPNQEEVDEAVKAVESFVRYLYG